MLRKADFSRTGTISVPDERNFKNSAIAFFYRKDYHHPMPMPKPRVKELVDVQQTSTEMYRIAKTYQDDMAPYASMSLSELFDLLKNLPFNADPPDTELIQRPWFTLNQTGMGGDCDDKAVCTGAWCHLRGIPFRFVAVSRSKNLPLHHVLTEMYINGEWFEFDPTYAFNVLGRPLCAYPQRLVLRP